MSDGSESCLSQKTRGELADTIITVRSLIRQAWTLLPMGVAAQATR
jgi:hypothetical protein